MNKWMTIALLCCSWISQAQKITGQVTDVTGNPLNAMIFLDGSSQKAETDASGRYTLAGIKPGSYKLVAFVAGYKTEYEEVTISRESALEVNFLLEELSEDLEEVTIEDSRSEELGLGWLESVSGAAIYEAKKTELINVDQLIGNKAANVGRQVYARVPGLNIWENDGAGINLGIGGRGLNPNRTSNFNVRQNGYDISADALGYPESYYTPPIQALDKIEIVRGAAGLQYGTQFGGMLNFEMKDGPKDKSIELESINTLGSFGLFNSYTSVGGTVDKLNYFTFYQYKHSDGWRPNSGQDQHNLYGSVKYDFTPFLSVKLDFTHMIYLAQQPGGLTDLEFLQNPRQSKRERNWFQVGWNLAAIEWNYRVSSRLKFNNRTFGLSANRYAVGNLERIDRLDDPDENRNLLKDEYLNIGNEFRAIYHYPFLKERSVLLVGNRIYFGRTLRAQGSANNEFGASFDFLNPLEPDDSDFTFPNENVAFFAENIFNLTSKLSVTPGVRHERIITRAEGYYFDRRLDQAGNVISEQKNFEDKTNRRSFTFFGIGLSYKHSDLLEFYSNFSENFRAINFNDIRVDNPSLEVDEDISDESGYNLDLGLRGVKPGKFRYDVSLFYLSYNDRIGSELRQDDNDPRFSFPVPRAYRFRTNIADAAIYGIEMYGEADLIQVFKLLSNKQSVTAFLNLALIGSEYLNDSQNSSIAGNEVELVPPVNLKTGVRYRRGALGVAFQYTYVARHFSDATNADSSPTAVEGVIPSYYVMDLSADYGYKFLTFEAGVNNLTDEYYFTRRAAGYPGPGIIPANGRNFYLGVGVKF